ncbi:MAG: hypothetical protein FWF67_04510 [Fibromonadales bacterium]|nr:hypothetical protein [Fibromonadales bacterium]
MRTFLFLLFSAFAALLVLSCSSDSNMPCITCPQLPPEYIGGSCKIEDYGEVPIGEQIWMKKNWGCYAKGSKCYGGDSINCNKYGRLYDWATATDTAKANRLCPAGWHLPTRSDWDKLVGFVENDSRCSDCAGYLLKAKEGWNDNSQEQSGNGIDKHDFMALPGGLDYFLEGDYGFWWSASEDNSKSGNAFSLYMVNYSDKSSFTSNKKASLLSVRCLKD